MRTDTPFWLIPSNLVALCVIACTVLVVLIAVIAPGIHDALLSVADSFGRSLGGR